MNNDQHQGRSSPNGSNNNSALRGRIPRGNHRLRGIRPRNAGQRALCRLPKAWPWVPSPGSPRNLRSRSGRPRGRNSRIWSSNGWGRCRHTGNLSRPLVGIRGRTGGPIGPFRWLVRWAGS